MTKKSLNSLWCYNRTSKDIVISELDLTLKRKQVVDLYQIKPTLLPVSVKYSLRFGVLGQKKEAGDLQILDGPPPVQNNNQIEPRYKEASEPILNRSKSIVTIDPAEKDFIEQLEADFMSDHGLLDDHERSQLSEKFLNEVDLEGFSDPLAEEDDDE